jgi:TonB family protein
MFWDRFGNRAFGLRRAAARLFQVAALGLVVAMALPARAADDRAVKSRVQPVYPEIAKRMKISGVVEVKVTVDAEGKVSDAKALSGNRLLSSAAEEAVRKWKFAPGSGESTVNVEINFSLTQ